MDALLLDPKPPWAALDPNRLSRIIGYMTTIMVPRDFTVEQRAQNDAQYAAVKSWGAPNRQCLNNPIEHFLVSSADIGGPALSVIVHCKTRAIYRTAWVELYALADGVRTIQEVRDRFAVLDIPYHMGQGFNWGFDHSWNEEDLLE